jgi:hypothetical protein
MTGVLIRWAVIVVLVVVLAGCSGVVVGHVAESGALVCAGSQCVAVGDDGGFALPLPAGVYDVSAAADCFVTRYAVGVVVVAGRVTDIGCTVMRLDPVRCGWQETIPDRWGGCVEISMGGW